MFEHEVIDDLRQRACELSATRSTKCMVRQCGLEDTVGCGFLPLRHEALGQRCNATSLEVGHPLSRKAPKPHRCCNLGWLVEVFGTYPVLCVVNKDVRDTSIPHSEASVATASGLTLAADRPHTGKDKVARLTSSTTDSERSQRTFVLKARSTATTVSFLNGAALVANLAHAAERADSAKYFPRVLAALCSKFVTKRQRPRILLSHGCMLVTGAVKHAPGSLLQPLHSRAPGSSALRSNCARV